MGCIDTIDAERFPEQGSFLGKNVRVCFKYNAGKTLMGVVVRDDIEEPSRMIIRLEDDRYILSTECQYSLITGHG